MRRTGRRGVVMRSKVGLGSVDELPARVIARVCSPKWRWTREAGGSVAKRQAGRVVVLVCRSSTAYLLVKVKARLCQEGLLDSRPDCLTE
jgi:hypothetical protein